MNIYYRLHLPDDSYCKVVVVGDTVCAATYWPVGWTDHIKDHKPLWFLIGKSVNEIEAFGYERVFEYYTWKDVGYDVWKNIPGCR